MYVPDFDLDGNAVNARYTHSWENKNINITSFFYQHYFGKIVQKTSFENWDREKLTVLTRHTNSQFWRREKQEKQERLPGGIYNNSATLCNDVLMVCLQSLQAAYKQSKWRGKKVSKDMYIV